MSYRHAADKARANNFQPLLNATASNSHTYSVTADGGLSQDTVEEAELDLSPWGDIPAKGGVRKFYAIDGSLHMVHAAHRTSPAVIAYGFVNVSVTCGEVNALYEARNTAEKAIETRSVTLDLACAGATEKPGITQTESWRYSVARLFASNYVPFADTFRDTPMTLMEALGLLEADDVTDVIESVTVKCSRPKCEGETRAPLDAEGVKCSARHCRARVFATDILGIDAQVSMGDLTNSNALSDLMNAVEAVVLTALIVLSGIDGSTDRRRNQRAFIVDGPLAIYSNSQRLQRIPAKILKAVQSIPGYTPLVFGVEKTGAVPNFCNRLVKQGLFDRETMLRVGIEVQEQARGRRLKSTYGTSKTWGAHFAYRTGLGNVFTISVPPAAGSIEKAFDDAPNPEIFPHLARVVGFIKAAQSKMGRNMLNPTILAHRGAAIPVKLTTEMVAHLVSKRLGGNVDVTDVRSVDKNGNLL